MMSPPFRDDLAGGRVPLVADSGPLLRLSEGGSGCQERERPCAKCEVLPFVRQATAFSYLSPYFVREHVDRRLGGRAGWRAVNLLKVCLMLTWTERATLYLVLGKTSSIAFQKPSVPSATSNAVAAFR